MGFEHIARDRWHNQQGLSHSALLAQYGTPMGWFKRSCYIGERGEADMLPYAETIRAAAVFNLRPTQTALFDTAYSLYVKHPIKTWHMLIVSVDQPALWIELAYKSGAQAVWLRPAGPVFQYQPIKHQIDTEPPAVTRRYKPGAKARPRGRHVVYDRESLIRDIKNTNLSLQQLAHQYNISKETVYKINRKLNLANAGRPILSRRAVIVDPAIEQQVVADAITGRMTKPMLAEKYKIGLDVVTKIIRRNRVTNLPRGFYAMILGQKKSP